MIRNPEELRRFEDALTAREKLDLERNLSIAEALYREAVVLGLFPQKNPLEGIETDIEVARVVNSVSGSP